MNTINKKLYTAAEVEDLVKAAVTLHLVARDREWVARIEKQRDEICCVGQETTLCRLADPCCSFMRKSCNWWQQFKKDMEAKP